MKTHQDRSIHSVNQPKRNGRTGALDTKYPWHREKRVANTLNTPTVAGLADARDMATDGAMRNLNSLTSITSVLRIATSAVIPSHSQRSIEPTDQLTPQCSRQTAPRRDF